MDHGTLLSVDGRVFQARAAAAENARSPSGPAGMTKSWRSSRPEMATCRHVGCQLQGLGENCPSASDVVFEMYMCVMDVQIFLWMKLSLTKWRILDLWKTCASVVPDLLIDANTSCFWTGLWALTYLIKDLIFAVPTSVDAVIQTYDVSGFIDLVEHTLSLTTGSEVRTNTCLEFSSNMIYFNV